MINLPNNMGLIFVNSLIVLIPVYFFHFVLSQTNKKIFNFYAGLFLGIISVLAMEFPIASGTVEGHVFIWDLRWIPFVFGVLYMGPIVGGISGLVLVGYRFGLGGGAAAINVFILAVILYIFVVLIRESYGSMTIFKKYVSSFFLSIVTFTIVLSAIGIHFHYINNISIFLSKGLSLFMNIGLSYIIVFLIYTYFLESTLSNIELREKVYQVEKLEMISDLAATFDHEVRNPLTAVRGFIELAMNQGNKVNQTYLNVAIQELDRVEFIISDYLNLAKSSKEKRYEKFCLSESLKETVLLMDAHSIKYCVKLTSEVEDDLYTYGDKFKFKQAILNLIKNALEATEYGEVVVSACFLEDTESIMMKITDNGRGMTKEEVRSLGKAYYTSKTEGTGQGVMATFQLIKAMNGTIEYVSEKGKGTIVKIGLNGIRENQSTITLVKSYN